MFLLPEELKSVAYLYRLEEIVDDDNAIILTAIETAIQEVQSYFTPNYKKEWGDGRLVYDVETIFNATGTNRNPLILQHTKISALWHLLILSNVDMIYEHVKERYDRTIDWLEQFAKGEVGLAGLPTKDISYEDEDGNPIATEPFVFGSRKKFHHE